MSDPQPDRLKPRPKRAEPLQPDRPGRGTRSEPAGGQPPDADAQRDSVREQKERSDTARDNNSQGFDAAAASA